MRSASTRIRRPAPGPVHGGRPPAAPVEPAFPQVRTVVVPADLPTHQTIRRLVPAGARVARLTARRRRAAVQVSLHLVTEAVAVAPDESERAF